jgi:hypothetical protein
LKTTKLLYRSDSEDFKMPAILPSKHEVVIVIHYHVKNAQGGWWERLIGILKRLLLRRVLGRSYLTYEQIPHKLDL